MNQSISFEGRALNEWVGGWVGGNQTAKSVPFVESGAGSFYAMLSGTRRHYRGTRQSHTTEKRMGRSERALFLQCRPGQVPGNEPVIIAPFLGTCKSL